MSTNKAKQSTNGKEDLSPVAKWTVMVYFAADNDLEEKAIGDLNEMKKVGSTDEVNIVAQLDSRGRGNTFRFRLRDEQTTLDEDVDVDPLLGPLPEINTGDPRELTDFIVWGAKKYQAENYMLVLWGHGRGWEDLDNADRAAAPTTDVVFYRDDSKNQLQDYYSVAMTLQNEIQTFIQGETKKQGMKRCLQSQLEREEFGRQLIRGIPPEPPPQGNGDHYVKESDLGLSKRIEGLSSIGFLTDQTPGRAHEISQDVLKMDELEFAIKEACNNVGTFNDNKIDILGMDACLMGMAEVGYQIRNHVKYLVASEDAILDEGWPYERILTRLVSNPGMSPEEFSVTIIREFLIKCREQNRDGTKSACSLSRSDALATAVGELAEKLKANIMNKRNSPAISAAILASRAMAQSFYIKDYVDLYDFCSYLSQLCEHKLIKQRCEDLMKVIRRKEPNNVGSQLTLDSELEEEPFVLAYGLFGHRLRGSNGISIYFPCFNLSQKYAKLTFAQETKWHEFLSELEKLVDRRNVLPTEAVNALSTTATFVRGKIKTDGGTPVKFGGGTPQIMPSLPPRRLHVSSDVSPKIQIVDKSADIKMYEAQALLSKSE